jgi:hypothetical protein
VFDHRPLGQLNQPDRECRISTGQGPLDRPEPSRPSTSDFAPHGRTVDIVRRSVVNVRSDPGYHAGSRCAAVTTAQVDKQCGSGARPHGVTATTGEGSKNGMSGRVFGD